MTDCYGETRWIDNDNLSSLPKKKNNQKQFSLTNGKQEYRGFREEDEDIEESKKYVEKLFRKGLL